MARPGAYMRLIAAGWTLTRAGLFELVVRTSPDAPPLPVRLLRFLGPRGTGARIGARLRDALVRLGPSYVKLGQFLATRADVVGVEIAEALSGLKDEMAPFDSAETRRIVRQTTDHAPEDLFVTISEPVAAA
ncbi:MAG: hypothetical protein AB7S46_13710, partial [Flavobacteriaceae bacterium]